jgi:hypothetical protein
VAAGGGRRIVTVADARDGGDAAVSISGFGVVTAFVRMHPLLEAPLTTLGELVGRVEARPQASGGCGLSSL